MSLLSVRAFVEFFRFHPKLGSGSFQITFDLFNLHALAFDFHLILFVQIKVVKVSGNGFKLGVDLGQEILENLEFQTAFFEYGGELALVIAETRGGTFALGFIA